MTLKDTSATHDVAGDVSRWARDVRERLQRLVTEQNWVELRAFVDENWMSIWFAFPPGSLPQVIADVPQSVLSGTTGGALLLTTSTAGEATGAQAIGQLPQGIRAIMHGLLLRTKNDPVGSYRILEPILRHINRQQREITPIIHPFYPPLLLQASISGLLAGDFSTADVWLERTARYGIVPQAPFTRRDALVTRALLHAAFGDAAIAASLVETISAEPRSDSWVEVVLDSALVFTNIGLRSRQGDHDLPADLLSLPWWTMQPNWPYALWIVGRTLLARGEGERLHLLARQLSDQGLASPNATGMLASALPIARAMSNLSMGMEVEPADRELLAACDDPIARYVRALDALAHEQPDDALALGVRDDRLINTMLAETVRVGAQAAILLAAGDPASATSILIEGISTSGILTSPVPMFLPAIVADHIARTPELASRGWTYISLGRSAPNVGLTEREREVFRMLLSDRSLREISEELGRTENTLKTHRRHLYRKLGVTSRDELRVLGMSQPSLWRTHAPSAASPD